jgi:ATP-dependent Clp protease protease subunit
MMHQPSAGAAGQASDVEITVNEVRKMKHELYEILSNHTGQTIEKIAKDSNRDFWMTADEAKEYGLVDEVLVTNSRKVKK